MEDKALFQGALERIEQLESALNQYVQPIAIIGTGMRLPGGINDLEGLWKLLNEEQHTTREIPSSRWDKDRWYDPDPEVHGKTYTNKASLIEDSDMFDRGFFRVSAEEAKMMDPMHRLLLETSWAALEDARITHHQLKNSPTGVFLGVGPSNYHGKEESEADFNNYNIVGSAAGFSAGRIAYTLGLNGPCVSMDTACSSSLAALHTAILSLRNGECDLAITGGVNLLTDPRSFVGLSQIKALSPDGLCKAFSSEANGFGRGEGCGVLVLRPLSLAQQNGDRILGVIRGSAINHDGASSGLTVPNGLSQEALMHQALANAGLTSGQIDYVECHGTGTALGDPIEVESLQGVFGRTSRERDLLIGTVKSNLGHLEAAAGVAGVLKVLACLQYDRLPRTLHTDRLNQKVNWESHRVSVLQKGVQWSKNDRPRRAGISSFGITGTNAHVILEEAPEFPEVVKASAVPALRSYELFPVSGNGTRALADQINSLKSHIITHSEQSTEALAYSLATTRSHFRSRTALIAKDHSDLMRKLSKPLEEFKPIKGKLAFLYTGGGAQYIGMGQELYKTEAIFKTTLDQCLLLIEKETGEDFKEIIFAKEGSVEAKRLNEIDYMLLALFSIEYSLTRHWQRWGIEPDILMGHSLGEIVAATVAGVFSLEDGIKLVTARGKLMASVKQPGKMATVEASIAELGPYLKQVEGVSIGGENGPQQTLISGAAAGIVYISELLEEAKIKVKILPISQGSHSPLMDEILPAFQKVAENISYHQPHYPLISNVSGKLAGDEIMTADYWTRHIRETVLFSTGMQALEAQGVTTYLEIGPEPNLIAMGGHCVSNYGDCLWLASLQSDTPDTKKMLESLGSLYSAGYNPDWNSFYQDREHEKIALPTYAFQRERYWLKPNYQGRGGMFTNHPLLGSELDIASQKVYERELSLKEFPYLEDHELMGEVVLPVAAIAEMIQGFIHLQKEDYQIEALFIELPLIIPRQGRTRIQLILEPAYEGYEFKIHSKVANNEWQKYASGKISAVKPDKLTPVNLEAYKNDLSMQGVESFYDHFESIGAGYETSFQVVKEIYASENRALGKISFHEYQSDGYCLHPISLDGCFQLAAIIGDDAAAYVPVEISGYQLSLPLVAGNIWAEVCCEESNENEKKIRIRIWDETGSPIGKVDALRLQKFDGSTFERKGLIRNDWLYKIDWEDIEVSPGAMKQGDWLLSANHDSDLATSLSTRLSDHPVTFLRISHDVPVAKGTTGLVSLWEVKGIASNLPEATEQLSSKALSQLQTALEAGVEDITWITRNVYNADGHVNLIHSPLWGLIRVAMTEHPDVRLRIIDLVDDSEASIWALSKLIKSKTEESQFRITMGQVEAIRLMRSGSQIGRKEISLDGSTVLISGGLGAMGLQTAMQLVQEYRVSHLLLLGRSKPGTEAKNVIKELRSAGVEVTIRSCDVADRDSLERIVESIPDQFPLKGVVHAAGVLKDGVLSKQNADRLHQNMRSKVYGGWNLHELTRHLELEIFVMYSSATTWFGANGHCNYVASNIFLDRLADYRQAQGLTGHTINWGPISDVGLAASPSPEGRRRTEQTGMGYFTAAEGFSLFDVVLKGSQPQTGIIPIKKHQLTRHVKDYYGYTPSVYKHVLKEQKKVLPENTYDVLSELPLEEQKPFLLQFLKEHIADVGAIEARDLSVNDTLSSLGFSSIQALELNNILKRKLQARLKISTLIGGISIDQLAQDLLEQQADSNRPKEGLFVYRHIDDLQLSGQQTPIFCLPGNGGKGFYFSHLASALGKSRPFYAFNSLAYSPEEFPACLEEIAQQFVNELLKKHPDGPYILAGHCSGSVIAFEMAHQLAALQKTVEHLFMFDSVFETSELDTDVNFRELTLMFIMKYLTVLKPESLPEIDDLKEMIMSNSHYTLIGKEILPLLDINVKETQYREVIDGIIENEAKEIFALVSYLKNHRLEPVDVPITQLAIKNEGSDMIISMGYELADFNKNIEAIRSLTLREFNLEYVYGNHINMLTREYCPALAKIMNSVMAGHKDPLLLKFEQDN